MRKMNIVAGLHMRPLLYVALSITGVYLSAYWLGFYRFTGVLSGTGNIDTSSLILGLLYLIIHLLFTWLTPVLILTAVLVNGIELSLKRYRAKCN